jgi:uncharacterized protein (TIGR03790 family)
MKDREIQGKTFGKPFLRPTKKGGVKPPKPEPPIVEPPDETPLPPPYPPPHPLASTVLVVANANSPQSVALAEAYRARRGVPAENRLDLNWKPQEEAYRCTRAEYDTLIFGPIMQKIATLPHIDYILLCRNLPLECQHVAQPRPGVWGELPVSVSSMLALGRWEIQRSHTYYKDDASYFPPPFKSGQYQNLKYLVTCLDGWTWDAAYSLIERGQGKLTKEGPILLDRAANRDQGGYLAYNMFMSQAATKLQAMGVRTILEATATFLAPTEPLGGYIGWGSNDGSYSLAVFDKLRFLPGAIAETIVSTSASNLRFAGGGQSQIAVLVKNGITGVQGFVSEPLVTATARAIYLFPFYVGGRTLAESFYAASPYAGWKGVVVGDPIAQAYVS